MSQKFRGELQRSVTRRDGRCSGVAPRLLLARNCAAASNCHCQTVSPKTAAYTRHCVYIHGSRRYISPSMRTQTLAAA
jgi:hypothetical protein